MVFMVIERYGPGKAVEVYRRFRDRGRMAPDGVRYIASWVDLQFREMLSSDGGRKRGDAEEVDRQLG